MLEDKEGKIEVLETKTNRSNKNKLFIKVSRIPKDFVDISYLWEANPKGIPFVDEVSFLPPVSMYKVRYQIDG
jgi:hypothetical protein